MSPVACSCSACQSPSFCEVMGMKRELSSADEHHLPGIAREFALGHPYDAFGFGLVVDARIEQHHARKLERIVEPRDIPTVGLVGDGRDAESGDVGRNAVVGVGRFVVLVVDDGAQRAVGLFFEMRIKRQRTRFRRTERGPVVMEQDVLRIACDTAARRILMVKRQESVPGVGDELQKGVAEKRFVECQFVEHLTQAFVLAVDLADEGRQTGLLYFVAGESLARDVVGFVVDDAAVGRRAAGHLRQGLGKEVVIAPAPEPVVLEPFRAASHVGFASVGDGDRTCFWFVHGSFY